MATRSEPIQPDRCRADRFLGATRCVKDGAEDGGAEDATVSRQAAETEPVGNDGFEGVRDGPGRMWGMILSMIDRRRLPRRFVHFCCCTGEFAAGLRTEAGYLITTRSRDTVPWCGCGDGDTGTLTSLTARR